MAQAGQEIAPTSNDKEYKVVGEIKGALRARATMDDLLAHNDPLRAAYKKMLFQPNATVAEIFRAVVHNVYSIDVYTPKIPMLTEVATSETIGSMAEFVEMSLVNMDAENIQASLTGVIRMIKESGQPAAQALMEECLVRMPNQNLTDDDARSVYEFMRRNDGVK